MVNGWSATQIIECLDPIVHIESANREPLLLPTHTHNNLHITIARTFVRQSDVVSFFQLFFKCQMLFWFGFFRLTHIYQKSHCTVLFVYCYLHFNMTLLAFDLRWFVSAVLFLWSSVELCSMAVSWAWAQKSLLEYCISEYIDCQEISLAKECAKKKEKRETDGVRERDQESATVIN